MDVRWPVGATVHKNINYLWPGDNGYLWARLNYLWARDSKSGQTYYLWARDTFSGPEIVSLAQRKLSPGQR